jgi:hypothetical protein
MASRRVNLSKSLEEYLMYAKIMAYFVTFIETNYNMRAISLPYIHKQEPCFASATLR